MKLYRIILSIFLFTALAGCTREPSVSREEGEASLCFSISAPHPASVVTKGGYASWEGAEDEDLSTWTDWDKYVDGRKMYRLLVMLVKDGTVVAYRDLPSERNTDNYFNAEATEATVNFLYDNPKRPIEKLFPGTYTLYAVANFGDISTYTDGGFDALVNSFKTAFDADAGLPETDAAFRGLKDYDIQAVSGEFVCKQEPQLLSLVKDISLKSGTNEASGELVRTYSRLRIKLVNMSDTNDLILNANGFGFETPFAQSHARLFDDGTWDAASAGKPSLTSEFAITSYDGTEKTIPYRDEETKEIHSAVLFDAYILGSSLGAYKYNLNLQFDGAEVMDKFRAVQSKAELAEMVGMAADDHADFLIQNARSSQKASDGNGWYMYEEYASGISINGKDAINSLRLDKTKTLEDIMGLKKSADPSQQALFNYYLWTIYSTGDGKYHIQNKETSSWTPTFTDALKTTPIYVVAEPERGTYTVEDRGVFTYKTFSNPTIAFYQNNLSFNNFSQQENIGLWTKDDGDRMVLYLISYKTASFADNITLQTVDPVTSKAVNVSSIRRNQYINATVTASFFKSGGAYEFIVEPWNDKSGQEITFN